MNENCHPHCEACVDQCDVELLEGIAMARTEEFVEERVGAPRVGVAAQITSTYQKDLAQVTARAEKAEALVATQHGALKRIAAINALAVVAIALVVWWIGGVA